MEVRFLVIDFLHFQLTNYISRSFSNFAIFLGNDLIIVNIIQSFIVTGSAEIERVKISLDMVLLHPKLQLGISL